MAAALPALGAVTSLVVDKFSQQVVAGLNIKAHAIVNGVVSVLISAFRPLPKDGVVQGLVVKGVEMLQG